MTNAAGCRTLLVVQNDPDVPLGRYAETFALLGIPCCTVRAYAGEPLSLTAETAGVIVLGGAMGANDEEAHPFLRRVKGFIALCLEKEVPFLGICLGGQLLADVAGGKVSSRTCGELGTLPLQLTGAGKLDPLFVGLSSPFYSFQWHNDSFTAPAGAVHLASSPVCPCQAFRCGRAYGLQFHPEVTGAIVATWAREIAVEPPLAGADAQRLLSEFDRLQPDYADASQRLIRNFLGLAGLLP